mgnify:CR=1 FL=1
MLNAEQLAWSKRLEKLLKAMPHGIEIIVGVGGVSIMKAGFYQNEINSTDVDLMTQGGTLIEENALRLFLTDADRVMVNSESI